MTWYPPSEAATIRALRLAAKHRSAEAALKDLRRLVDLAQREGLAAALPDLRRCEAILKAWKEWGG